ncbi:MAG: 1-acyl-sn-glycerol-3-phosphate acyltransferase [Planctomycetaceae bacterium]|nr:1-acyl-sn-glycerol-3-phosphate acyltransferase [Planctomycetaceae bacterium]
MHLFASDQRQRSDACDESRRTTGSDHWVRGIALVGIALVTIRPETRNPQQLLVLRFMNPVYLTSIVLGLALLVTPVVLALRCPAGWGVWVCYRLSALLSIYPWRWRARNECSYPEEGPAIIVANHTSPADPVLLWVRHFERFRKPRLRVIGYMMAREYYVGRGPVGWVCRTMQSIPADRSGRDMGPVKDALRRLEAGHLLGLFPEGRLNTRSPDECLLKGGTGVAWLAIKSGAPVIPVFIQNAPRSRSMVRAFLMPTRVRVRYGQPLDLSKWDGHKPSRAVLTEMTDHIMKSIADLGGIRFTPTSRGEVDSGPQE